MESDRMRLSAYRSTIVLLLGLLAAPTLAHAQQVERSGSADVAIDRRLRALLASEYLLVTGDTVLREGQTVPTSVLVLDATMIIEGTVQGDVIAIAAGVFVRPTARIEGDLVNAAGGVYRSELATIGGSIVDVPTAPYRVVRDADRFIIEARDDSSPARLDGLYGFRMPTYDRVDGLSLRWGATYLAPLLGEVVPEVHGEVGYRTEREAVTGGGELRLRRRGTTLMLGAERQTYTNETWILGPLSNTAAFFLSASDYRNYYGADRYRVRVGQEFGDLNKSVFVATTAALRLEDGFSLPGSDPWTLFSDDPRPNPGIDDGRISSIVLGVEGVWGGQSAALDGGLEVELAREFIGGDHEFDRYELWADLATQGFSDHTVRIEGRFMGPLPGTDRLPRQRWSLIGGRETLETFSFGEFPGDRVVFVRSRYIMPLPDALRLPLLGIPDLHLIHAIGKGWTKGLDRSFEQNIGVRLQTFGPWIRFMVDPTDLDERDVDFGMQLDFGGTYPWQR